MSTVQKLDLKYRLAPSRKMPGRVWRTIARKRNSVVAEMCARFARIDDADALVRVTR